MKIVADKCDKCGAAMGQRSKVSHDHYFASVEEAWKNLPEDIAQDFPTSDHLRKWALVQAGYRTEQSIVCSSKLDARRIAAFVGEVDDYAVVLVRGNVVRVYKAQSQSYKAMGKKVFQESKDRVLDVVSKLIGVSTSDLSANARAA